MDNKNVKLHMISRGTGQLQPNPQIFFQKKLRFFISLGVYTYVVTAC